LNRLYPNLLRLFNLQQLLLILRRLSNESNRIDDVDGEDAPRPFIDDDVVFTTIEITNGIEPP